MQELLRDVEAYFEDKIKTHGATHYGVDFTTPSAQTNRFEQLVKVVDGDEAFSINDYGSGYGALVEFLATRWTDFAYCGFDISKAMRTVGESLYASDTRIRFTGDYAELDMADYTVASGTFNIKLDCDSDTWQRYVVEEVGRMAAVSKKGFAFNMLTSYSDPEHMRDDLYYGDPLLYFDHCKRKFSRNVALLHDYNGFDFTIIVRL
ncbi:class I SAM-dependent methyltransferase [Actinoallomurus sp. NPDC052308]|uniref:class I SAM-dependent methyltransferase n=1 Tax=Actinoallomurus sp. NPDC052308 TaxID=3155530 RepID=UPI00342C291C